MAAAALGLGAILSEAVEPGVIEPVRTGKAPRCCDSNWTRSRFRACLLIIVRSPQHRRPVRTSITSVGLAGLLGHSIACTQIRKDLSALGPLGRPRARLCDKTVSRAARSGSRIEA